MYKITANIAMEIVFHEAIVREAYRDSVGVWTWGVGITTASGHDVYPRYLDNPQSLEKCLKVFIWLLRETYAPVVEETFAGHRLSEAQFGAALSFHYNTGSVHRAEWVKLWIEGDRDAAKDAFMNWSKPSQIIPRRTKERDLFFDGVWSNDGSAVEYPITKPDYQPDLHNGFKVDIRIILQKLIA